MSLYLDHNATTPLDPRVGEAMLRVARDGLANPASQHQAGRRARRLLEEAREGIGAIVGADVTSLQGDRLLFTSGGTEANNLALAGLAAAGFAREPQRRTVVVSAIEHPSVLQGAEALRQRGFEIERWPVTSSGVIDRSQAGALLESRPAVVSLMLGNHETGVLQPVAEIAALCAAAGVLLHCDAVQAVGKIAVNFRQLGVSAMTFTPHKFHGPVGIGALLVRSGVELQPMLFGGFQQGALRPGTEPVALAVGFHEALKLWLSEAAEREQKLRNLRDELEQQLLAEASDVVIVGAEAPRLPQTTNVAFLGVNRQALVMALDVAGVACSSGSACASGSSEPSPVLLAMGLPTAVVESSIRLSMGIGLTAVDIAEAARRILFVVNQLRRQKSA